MAFLGMRGNGDWATDQRPLNWRETILLLFPNGSAPLTAIMSKMASEKVNDPQFHWWTKTTPDQAGAITGIFTDVLLANAYVTGGVAGDILYLQVSADTVSQIRIGHQVLMRDASDLTVDVQAKVVSREANGASSYLGVKLLEADDNSTSGDLSDADRVIVVGNINPEGGAMPDTIAYDPVKWFNYTQIFRTPLEITRTAALTHLRTGDQLKEMKREALELHSIEMEKALWFGVPTENTGDNGKPERTTLGIIPAIRGGYTGHGGTAGTTTDYPTDTDFTGLTWLQGGESWIDTNLEIAFRFGKNEKLGMCGSLALQGINRLVKGISAARFDFTPTTTSYGIKVVQWVTPHGVLNLMTHPLFNLEPTLRSTMVIFEPANLRYRFVSDTFFKKDKLLKDGGWTSRDGTKDEFLTEMGMEYHHPRSWVYMTGVGVDNDL